VAAKPGEAVGRLRLSVPRLALPFVIDPVLPTFRTRHPRIEVDVAVSDRLVDVVAEGFDAGVRSSDVIERDMVQVRLTEPFRFVVVGAPDYLARHGTPQRPEDLLRHECLTFRSQTTGARVAIVGMGGLGHLALKLSGSRRQPAEGSRASPGVASSMRSRRRCRPSPVRTSTHRTSVACRSMTTPVTFTVRSPGLPSERR
jgi:DNA-binding transcriptional LysR family regulator